MNNKRLLISIQDFVPIGVFLLSIFLHTEFSASFLGMSLRHLFILITIPFGLKHFLYKNNREFGILVFLQFFLFLVLGLFLPEYKVNSGVLYSYLLYCIPFFFDSAFYSGWSKKGVKLAFLGSIILLFLWNNFGFFRFWNDNCIAYLYFGGVNLYLAITFLKNKGRESNLKERILFFCLFIYGIYLLFQTNSRNIVIAELFVLIPIVFKGIFKKKFFYYIIAIFSMLYSALNVWINTYIQNNSKWYNIILQFSSKYFEKDTVFDGRLMLQQKALKQISEHFFVGHGYDCYSIGLAPHNNFLVMMFTTGLIGVLIYYLFVFKVFRMAHENFCQGDNISFVCAVILMGFMIQLGAESFLVGNNIIVLMPYFFMGVIIYRNRSIKYEKIRTVENMD